MTNIGLHEGSHLDKWKRLTYDVARDGGEAGAHTMRDENGDVYRIPERAIIAGFFVETEEAFVSEGATTVKVGMDDSDFGSTAFQNDVSFDDVGYDPTNPYLPCAGENGSMNASGNKVLNPGGALPIVTVTGDPLTAGKIHLHVDLRAGV